MDQPQKNIQKIRHQKPEYDLQVTYNSGQALSQQDEGKQGKLSINLRVKTSPKIKAYRVQYTQNNAPRELLSSFTSLDIVFYCLSQEDGFEVNLTNGAVVVKVECEIRGRKFLKECVIDLIEYELSEYQLMMQQIHQTQIQVQILKQTNSDYTQKIKSHYQQKLSAQAQKYEKLLEQRKLEEIKTKQKQNQLQIEVQQLKNQIQHLNNKIQWFVKRQMTELQKFMYQIQRLQAEQRRVFEELDDVLVLKRGYQGRKRFHENDGDVKNRSEVGSTPPKEKQQKHGNSKGWVDVSQEKSSSLWERPAKMNRFHKDSLQFIDEFEFKQNKITVNSRSKWRQLIFNTRIEKQRTQYKIKIIKLVNQNMKIGIIDYTEVDIPKKKKYIICYYSINGRTIGCEDCSSSCDFQGSGYKQGDTINMTVYLDKACVQWRVNGELKATCHANSILSQKIGRFFPYVELIDRCDCIQWTEI